MNLLLLLGGWPGGGTRRILLTFLVLDVVILAGWLLIGIPIRRWLSRSPY